jgi:predicted CXXCH cytochrome family protein
VKKFLPVVLLAVVLTFAFATTAYATSAKTWNYTSDYYTWGSYAGNGSVTTSPTLGQIGDNPTNPGVHGNYMATTAKCGICHSVHRANAAGVRLLNTATATCAGCHKAGASTVTNVLVSWEVGGPHSSGNDASCNYRGCHVNNPHGAGGSKYKIFAAKLLKSQVDTAVADALADPNSGITTADLNADSTSTWGAKTRSAVVIGYTCNTGGCHQQSMLTVLR